MAHVGKFWKLWWRRDASVFVNNYANGFGEAYQIIGAGPWFSSRYRIDALHLVPAINLSKDFDPVWTSVPVGNFFDNVFWRVTLPIEPTLGVSTMRVEVRHNAAVPTPVFDATYKLGLPFGQYDRFSVGELQTLHFLSPDLDMNPDSFGFNIRAARWDVYNP